MDYETEVQFRADLKKSLADLDDELDTCYVGITCPPHPWLEKLREVLRRRRDIRETLKSKGIL